MNGGKVSSISLILSQAHHRRLHNNNRILHQMSKSRQRPTLPICSDWHLVSHSRASTIKHGNEPYVVTKEEGSRIFIAYNATTRSLGSVSEGRGIEGRRRSTRSRPAATQRWANGARTQESQNKHPWTPAEEQRLKTMRDAGNSWGEIAKVGATTTGSET